MCVQSSAEQNYQPVQERMDGVGPCSVCAVGVGRATGTDWGQRFNGLPRVFAADIETCQPL